MKIGIIGAGQIGGTLTRRLRALGHEVFVANSRGPETLADLAAETGATAVPVAEAARSGELVVVTIPQSGRLVPGDPARHHPHLPLRRARYLNSPADPPRAGAHHHRKKMWGLILGEGSSGPLPPQAIARRSKDSG
jgi:uncharacterized protein YbjT (DUF2867 family)